MMKKLLFCLPVLLFLAVTIQAREAGSQATATNLKPALPLLFAENKGQVTDKAGKARPDILFVATSDAVQVLLTASGIQYQFSHIVENKTAEGKAAKEVMTETHLFSLVLKEANEQPLIRKERKNAFTQHFYTAHLPQNGITNVATYEQITYENIYPGIDWVVYSKAGQMKYDFVVHPGADPSLIRLDVNDAESVSITEKGELLMRTSLGDIREKAPVSFADGKAVPSHFKQYADGTIGFEVTTTPGATLVIDPSVTWATYYGGSGQEDAEGLTLDASGNIYMAGTTTSATGVAMAGGFQTSMVATVDNFIVKFNSSGTPLWATYYGSSYATNPASNPEFGGACTTDNAGNVYFWGTTAVAPLSSNMTTAGAYQTTQGGASDAYLVKFDATGIRQWATYFGGSGNEYSYGCVSNAAGDVYVSGITASTNGIATAGAHQAVNGGGPSDLFLAKFNTTGSLQWGTYIGGAGSEGQGAYASFVFHNCALDNSGNVVVASSTTSTSGMASAGAQQTTLNAGMDVFLGKFSPAGTRLWSTYFGGNDQDGFAGSSVAADATGNIYLSGETYSTAGIATAGANQTTFGGIGDNFLAKYNSAGVLQWATYEGAADYEFPGTIAVNAAGSIYLTASTYSFNTLTGGFQNFNSGGSEGIIVKFSPAGTVQWRSYFGGPGTDMITAGIPSGQDLYILGKTQSTTGVATPGAFKTTLTGTSRDAFLAKISDIPVCIPDSVVVTETTCSNQLPFIWGGQSIATGGVDIATDTLTNTQGCDSVLHLTLIVKPVAVTTLYDTACRNDFPHTTGPVTIPVAPVGNTASDTALLSAVNGCDSLVILNLFVRDTSAVTETKTYCRNNLPATWNGITIPVTAVSNPAYATYAINNIGGCDSVTTLNLIIRDTSAVTETKTYCRNELPATWNGIAIPVTAVSNPAYTTYSTFNTWNCDSVVTLNLIVKDTSVAAIDTAICANLLPIVWNGITVLTAGTPAATYTTTNAVGCDSVVRLNVTVKNTSAFTELMTKCSNQLPFLWNGINVTAGGPSAASVILTNSAGCDSVVTLNLIISNTSAVTVYDTICASELPYLWHGISVTAGGPNAATLNDTNVAGCDSIVTLNLTVNPTVVPTINITATPGTSVPVGTPVTFTATITNGGISPVFQWRRNGVNEGPNSASYTVFSINSGDVFTCVLVSDAPCADPDTATSNPLAITVTIPPPPCLVPTTLVSTDIQFSTAVFRWAHVIAASGYEIVLDMQPSDPSAGMFTTDTAYHASALSPGTHYFHIRTRCTNGDYSPWIKIMITILDPTGIAGTKENADLLSLYPNPNNGIFNVMGTVPENKAHVDIVDKIGRVIYQADATTPGGKLNHRVDLTDNISQGIYLLRVSSGDQVTVIRFVHN